MLLLAVVWLAGCWVSDEVDGGGGGGGMINRCYVWLVGCRVGGVVDSGGV